VIRLLTPKLGAYAALTAAGLLAAILFARPEAAVLALPFALLAILGMASVREPRLELESRLDRERVLEGEQAVLAVRFRAAAPVRHRCCAEPHKRGLAGAPGTIRRLRAFVCGAASNKYRLMTSLTRARMRSVVACGAHSNKIGCRDKWQWIIEGHHRTR